MTKLKDLLSRFFSSSVVSFLAGLIFHTLLNVFVSSLTQVLISSAAVTNDSYFQVMR